MVSGGQSITAELLRRNIGPPYPGRYADETGEFQYAVGCPARVAAFYMESSLPGDGDVEMFPFSVFTAFYDDVGFVSVCSLRRISENAFIVVAEHGESALYDRRRFFVHIDGERTAVGYERECIGF